MHQIIAYYSSSGWDGRAVIIAIAAVIFVCYGIVLTIHFFVLRLLAWMMTPRGCRSFSDYRRTETYHSLRKENYGVTLHWESDAVAQIRKEK